MKFLIVNAKEQYAGKLQLMREACVASGLQVDMWDKADVSDIVDHALRDQYAAIIHRNEHGRLFADGSIEWVQQAVAKGLPVLSMDFGYFNHYKTFMFDYYRRHDLSSGIHDEWADLPDVVKWQKAAKYVRKFRGEVFEHIARADGSRYAGKVGVWMQWNAKLIRPELGRMQQWEWINLVCGKIAALGLEPVVKMGIVDHSEIYRQTIPKVDPGIRLVCDKPKVAGSNERAFYDPNANWNMLAGCSYHVLMCSSVSHLMILADKPAIATGQSWFNALDVFQEPVEWHSPLIRPTVNAQARAKWINWWLSRQCLFKDSPKRLVEVYQLAAKHFGL